jgi:hypothetical protein
MFIELAVVGLEEAPLGAAYLWDRYFAPEGALILTGSGSSTNISLLME